MMDFLKNLGDLPSLMAKARQMQDKMQEAQEELKKKMVTADAAGGMVTATVNGRMELVRLRIDRARLSAGPMTQADVETLEDVICAAVAAAQTKAAALIQEDMGKIATDMGLPAGGGLPGGFKLPGM